MFRQALVLQAQLLYRSQPLGDRARPPIREIFVDLAFGGGERQRA
jgi:hypothetical protein